MTETQLLTKTMNLLTQVMRNYKNDSCFVEREGYETCFEQDDILVNFLKNEVSQRMEEIK